jgi:inner membrane protein
MEPVTHFLTGACIGRSGLNRKTAYATLAAVLAAEAADIDIVWGLAGPVQELRHHRGITHTFLAAPFLAAVVVAAVWLLDRCLEKRRLVKVAAAQSKDPGAPLRSNLQRQPIRWGWLYAAALLASLSHLLLDWTNNYGLRPFFPFNARWYAGSFVFIAEPVAWALLLAAMVVPWLLGMADREIGARRQPFRGRAWAIFALIGLFLLGSWRWAEHAQALAMVDNTQVAEAPVKRVAMEPYPVNPFRWHAILETPDYFQTAEVDTRKGTIDSDPHRDLLYKPASTPATEAARRSPLGQVYLDWASWAVVRDAGPLAIAPLDPPQLPPSRTWTTVQFNDLRFSYPFLGAGRPMPNPPPLSGWVYVVDGRDLAGQALNGKEQR